MAGEAEVLLVDSLAYHHHHRAGFLSTATRFAQPDLSFALSMISAALSFICLSLQSSSETWSEYERRASWHSASMRWRNVGCEERIDVGWLVNSHAQDVPCEL